MTARQPASPQLPHAPRARGRSLTACGQDGFTLLELVLVLAILVVAAGVAILAVTGTRERAVETVTWATLRAVRDAIAGTSEAPGYLADMRPVPGFRIADVRVHDLLSASSYPASAAFDPLARRGWRGPYVRNTAGVANTNPARNGLFPAAHERRSADDATFLQRGFFHSDTESYYGLTGDLAVADAWGNPIVLQVPPTEAFALSSGDAKRFRYARLVSAGPDGVLETPRDRLGGSAAARDDDLVCFIIRADVYEDEEP